MSRMAAPTRVLACASAAMVQCNVITSASCKATQRTKAHGPSGRTVAERRLGTVEPRRAKGLDAGARRCMMKCAGRKQTASDDRAGRVYEQRPDERHPSPNVVRSTTLATEHLALDRRIQEVLIKRRNRAGKNGSPHDSGRERVAPSHRG